MGILLLPFKLIWGLLSFAFGAVGVIISFVLGLLGAIFSGIFAVFFVPIVILIVINLFCRRRA